MGNGNSQREKIVEVSTQARITRSRLPKCDTYSLRVLFSDLSGPGARRAQARLRSLERLWFPGGNINSQREKR